MIKIEQFGSSAEELIGPNRFRELGFIEYNGRIPVHEAPFNVVLRSQLRRTGYRTHLGEDSWSIGNKVIPPVGILRSASDRSNQSSLYQRCESRSGCAGRELNLFGDLRGGKPSPQVLSERRKNSLIADVFR